MPDLSQQRDRRPLLRSPLRRLRLQEEARDVDDEVGGTAATAKNVELAVAAKGDDASIGNQLIGLEPVDRGVTEERRAGREQAEEARAHSVGDGQVVSNGTG